MFPSSEQANNFAGTREMDSPTSDWQGGTHPHKPQILVNRQAGHEVADDWGPPKPNSEPFIDDQSATAKRYQAVTGAEWNHDEWPETWMSDSNSSAGDSGDSDNDSNAEALLAPPTDNLPTDDADLSATTYAGFQQHILTLNPLLRASNTYLVDRIAHQQIVRHKGLQLKKFLHSRQVEGAKICPSGTCCIALGGCSELLEDRNLEPPLASNDDEEIGFSEISPESFPSGIPMPPTTRLPATLECQICYQVKAFARPSDWTKHVIEDLRPYTCTWDRCRDRRMFTSKANWVRHENEAHRHLEWWVCDAEDCQHVCYQQHDFLQHLVREHKFTEPRAINPQSKIYKISKKKDPTWQEVEICREETRIEPSDEPCRFCGKAFPTWERLVVHLAKHMEQITFPLLSLTAQEELTAESLSSSTQDATPLASFLGTSMSLPNSSPASWLHTERLAGFPPATEHYATPSLSSPISGNKGASGSSVLIPREGGKDSSVTAFAVKDAPATAERSKLPLEMDQADGGPVRQTSKPQESISLTALERKPLDGIAMEVDPMEQSVSRSQGSTTLLPLDKELTDVDGTKRAIVGQRVSRPQGEMSVPLNFDFRQIGVAKVRVELLSVSRLLDRGHESADSEVSSTDDDDEPVELDGEQPGQSNNSNLGSSGAIQTGLIGTRQSARGGSGSSGNGQRNSRSRDRGSGGQDGGRKRRRQNSPESDKERFACPYQTYEPLQDCLRQGPRNPKGGCDGLSRLKQHLSRRHMISFRCQTCWRSFDSKCTQHEHVQIGTCSTKPKPDSERFMDLNQEAEVEKPCGSISEEDVWWKLFQLLIPGMGMCNVPVLKRQYSPYYFACNMSLTIPSLNFLNVDFADQLVQFDGSSSNVFEPFGFAASSSERPQVLSQTLSVPVSWSEHQLPSESWSRVDPTPSETSWVNLVATAPSSSGSISNSNLAPPVMGSVFSSVTQSSAASDSTTTQLRRNNDRLKARVQRAEGEVTEFHVVVQAVRADIGLADGIVEGLMDSQDISPATYESLERLSKLLETASGRLRRAV